MTLKSTTSERLDPAPLLSRDQERVFSAMPEQMRHRPRRRKTRRRMVQSVTRLLQAGPFIHYTGGLLNAPTHLRSRFDRIACSLAPRRTWLCADHRGPETRWGSHIALSMLFSNI